MWQCPHEVPRRLVGYSVPWKVYGDDECGTFCMAWSNPAEYVFWHGNFVVFVVQCVLLCVMQFSRGYWVFFSVSLFDAKSYVGGDA